MPQFPCEFYEHSLALAPGPYSAADSAQMGSEEHAFSLFRRAAAERRLFFFFFLSRLFGAHSSSSAFSSAASALVEAIKKRIKNFSDLICPAIMPAAPGAARGEGAQLPAWELEVDIR